MNRVKESGRLILLASLIIAGIVSIGLALNYVIGVVAERDRLGAENGALRARVPATVSPSPTPSPTEQEPTPDDSGEPAPAPGDDSRSVAAASGAREPVSRSPRDPGTGGSSSRRPGPERPPAAAPPAEESEQDCGSDALLSLCLELGLLSAEESEEP